LVGFVGVDVDDRVPGFRIDGAQIVVSVAQAHLDVTRETTRRFSAMEAYHSVAAAGEDFDDVTAHESRTA
jgi:hypothetical protein